MNKWNPFRSIILIYSSIILVGTLLLLIPASNTGLTFIDSLFTSTSAVCVTGLIVKDTALDFTFLGKSIILFLIQIGGMGYMAFASLFMFIFNRKPDKRQEMVTQTEFGLFTQHNTFSFLRRVVLMTFVFELVGIAFLFWGFSRDFNFDMAMGHAIFQSVSAFCNAGFSSFSTNLVGFENNLPVALTTPFLFIMGGMGFIVLLDLGRRLMGEERHLSGHSRVVIITTIILLLIGTLSVYFLEYGNILNGEGQISRWIISFYTSATPRTAGFSLISIGKLLPTTILILIFFMFIGASPGGTGGGIKTTTFVIVQSFIFARLRGQKFVNIQRRRILDQQLNKALTLFLISLILVGIMCCILTFSEMDIIKERGLLPVLFEEVSAFGTVGLSMGSSERPILSLAHDFSPLGKIVLIITMIAGRVGPLTLLAMVVSRKGRRIQYPPAKIQIG